MSERRYVHVRVLKREPVAFKDAAELVKGMVTNEDTALPSNETQTLLRIAASLEELEQLKLAPIDSGIPKVG
ncbi:hypothetical protein PSENEW3_00000408 [Picochlorum sp. SENEW3]|nr:hypothetical protein PSENEW3_00000408 [Picochlorum sp. SENEW3]